jgi:long-chain acyl-CoA synthetase
MEMAIALHPLFEQVLVIGDNRPFLSAILVLNREQWILQARELGLDPDDHAALEDRNAQETIRKMLDELLAEFPGYARIHSVSCTLEPWSIENGLITPTLKLKRSRILEHFSGTIEQMYSGH